MHQYFALKQQLGLLLQQLPIYWNQFQTNHLFTARQTLRYSNSRMIQNFNLGASSIWRELSEPLYLLWGDAHLQPLKLCLFIGQKEILIMQLHSLLWRRVINSPAISLIKLTKCLVSKRGGLLRQQFIQIKIKLCTFPVQEKGFTGP